MLVDVYVNGNWDASCEIFKEVRVWVKGSVYQMDSNLFDKFIDNLEETGFDNYFCPQLFKNPDWNGIIIYEK